MNKVKYIYSTNFIKYFIYLIWPIGSAFVAVSRLNSKSYKVIILVLVFFGYTYNVSDFTDMAAYVNQFYSISSWTLRELIAAYFSGAYSDYYSISLAYLVSRFSADGQVYIAFIILVFSFFYINTIRLILDKFWLKRSFLTKVLVFLLFFYVSFFYINSLRFFTAFYVFFYAFLQIHFNNRNVFYLLAIITPIIHIAFMPIISILLLYRIFNRNRFLCIILVLLSFSTRPYIDFSKYTNNENAQSKIEGYTTEYGKELFYSYRELAQANASDRFKVFKGINETHYLIIQISFLLLLMVRNNRYIIDKIDNKIINTNLIILAITNFLTSFAEGYRYNYIFGFSLLISYFLLANHFIKLNLQTKLIFGFYMAGMLIFVFSYIYVQSVAISFEFLITNWFYVLFT